MKLALGPLLYFWRRETVMEYYSAAAEWPVDIVYLGETVCAKRRALRLNDWLEIAAHLQAAGKQVVLSTLALLEAESELLALQRIADNGEFWVEANDFGAVRLLAGRVPFVVGPHINSYNTATLTLLAELGARRWVLPVELSRDTLTQLQQARPAGMETEVFAFGRLPLAFSARCFTARALNLPKDDCQLRCGDYADGMAMHTREGANLFTLNGIQVQSGGTCNLLGAVDELRNQGVDVLRLSPQSTGMTEIVGLFDAVVKGRLALRDAEQRSTAFLANDACNGYWYGQPGMRWEVTETAGE